MADREIFIPADLELSEEDMELIRARLEAEPIERFEGERARIVFAKEKDKVQSKEEVAKEKSLPIEKAKIK